MENAAIALRLRKIADLLEYQGVAFKPAAYRRAAQTVDDLAKDIALYTTPKQLMELPGIGEAIASKILEYVQTGEMPLLAKLQAETQMGATELFGVENLGPRRIRDIEQQLGVRTIAELIQAGEAGKLRSLPRMSELMEKKILESARNATIRGKRFSLEEAKPDIELLLHDLRTMPGVLRAEAAGSYRRKKETIGDVDILIAVDARTTKNGKAAESIRSKLEKLKQVGPIVAAGPTKISFDLRSGLRVDIRIIKLHEWGSALAYFTGSKEHNIAMRKLAIEKGLKLSEYGLFRGETVVASKTEEDVYKALGLEYVQPEMRTGNL